MKFCALLLLTLLILPIKAWSSLDMSSKQLKVWEKLALEEIDKYKIKYPEKEFLLYMIAGRELMAHGEEKKSREYYLKAFEHPSKSDKSEAVIQLVTLDRENSKELSKSLVRARQWYKANPKSLQPEIDRWLKMMEGYAAGNTPYQDQGYHTVWAKDARISELMGEGKAEEALKILGPGNFENANINQKVRQDLLSAVVLGKEAAPPLWCKSSLDKYPTSLTWTMRLCRYLDDWKTGKKSRETIQTVRDQIKSESPERLSWVRLLERL